MSAQFKTLLTEFGAAKLAEIQATNGPLNLQSMAIGDGGGQAVQPSSSQTSLVNETHRAQINTLTQDTNNPSYYIAELVVPADVGGWYVREIGLYDDQGNLFAIGNVPETYKPLLSSGSSRDQVFRMIVEIGSSANVTLRIDSAMVLATRAYVDMRDETKLDKNLRSNATNSNSSETVATSKALKETHELSLHAAPAGMIGFFAMASAPSGWLKANGAAVSRKLYANLFDVIGTRYGEGDGSTTFNLPDARGLFPRAWDDGKGGDKERELGSEQGDAIRNITGAYHTNNGFTPEGGNPDVGALYRGRDKENRIPLSSVATEDAGDIYFDASRVVPTAEENRPKNIAWLVCIKY